MEMVPCPKHPDEILINYSAGLNKVLSPSDFENTEYTKQQGVVTIKHARIAAEQKIDHALESLVGDQERIR